MFLAVAVCERACVRACESDDDDVGDDQSGKLKLNDEMTEPKRAVLCNSQPCKPLRFGSNVALTTCVSHLS